MEDNVEIERAPRLQQLTGTSSRKLTPEEEAFLNGDKITIEDKSYLVTAPDGVTPNDVAYDSSVDTLNVYMQNITNIPVHNGEATIQIPNQRRPVIIACDVTAPNGRVVKFSVEIRANIVERNEDGISVVMTRDVDICPPSLVPLTLRTGGHTFQVIYAGGKCKLNDRFVNISFVIIEDGEKSSSEQ